MKQSNVAAKYRHNYCNKKSAPTSGFLGIESTRRYRGTRRSLAGCTEMHREELCSLCEFLCPGLGALGDDYTARAFRISLQALLTGLWRYFYLAGSGRESASGCYLHGRRLRLGHFFHIGQHLVGHFVKGADDHLFG